MAVLNIHFQYSNLPVVIRMKQSGRFFLSCVFLLVNCSNPDDPNPIVERSDDVVIISRARKIHQLVGDFDRERQEPTLNLTQTRYGLIATDLGIPFVYDNRTYVLFGDSFGGADPADDAIAYTTDTNPEDGIELEFIQNLDGTYRPIIIPGIPRGGYEVPVEGVSIGDTMYIYFATDWDEGRESMTRTVLARSEDNGFSFAHICDFSTNHFINVSIAEVSAAEWEGLPDNQGEGLMIFGSGEYRKSCVFLAYQSTEDVEDPSKVRYFSGLNNSNQPIWSTREADAVPLFDQSMVGELSVVYYPIFGKWIMLYNNSLPRGINMRSADDPWGPWSDTQVIFHPWDDEGYGHFMHVSWEHAVMDSVHGQGRENEWGGEYGPYQFEDLARATNESITIYFTMSTWNPYTVVLMKAILGKE